MNNYDEILQEKTYKDTPDLEKRIFYTLTVVKQEDNKTGENKEKVQLYRIAKAVSLLAKILRDRDIVSDEDIDKLLFEVVG